MCVNENNGEVTGVDTLLYTIPARLDNTTDGERSLRLLNAV